MPTLNIVYYDPFNTDEEDYVAAHYLNGERCETIHTFYAAMREWRNKPDRIIPLYEAADARYYPDMAFAGVRAGIFAMGQLFIRNLIREYRCKDKSA